MAEALICGVAPLLLSYNTERTAEQKIPSSKALPVDPYAELGIGKAASTAEVRRAYRCKAKKAHPDKGGTEVEFERLTQAHLVLSDPVRRAKFDETGKMDLGPEDAGDAAALQEISGALSSVFLQAGEMPDVKKAALALLDAKKQHIETQAVPLKRAIARAQKAQNRFKRKKAGENVIARMIGWQLKSWTTASNTMDGQVAILKRAADILREYDFDAPPPDSAYTRTGSVYFSTANNNIW